MPLFLIALLPLGLDTLAVSLSLGIKSVSPAAAQDKAAFPYWLRSALLFSLAESLMPLVGLLIGYTVSLAVSGIMHYAGALILVGIGAWELWEEGREHFARTKRPARIEQRSSSRFAWGEQLLLALSVSLDELAIGFSLGSLPFGKAISPLALSIYIGIQGLCMAVLGIALGRLLRVRLKLLKEWSELISAVLLIGLGVWLLFFS